tara:strand:+ start:622 stop:987 length:366 start_codon:yes stop_codon:yes gene_type:complete
MHPSGISQELALATLESLGEEGLKKHIHKVSTFYRERRDHFCKLASKHLDGLAEWSAPEAGMFVWFKLNGIEDSLDLIQKEAVDAKVLLVPGKAFVDSGTSPYVRASFSTGTGIYLLIDRR